MGNTTANLHKDLNEVRESLKSARAEFQTSEPPGDLLFLPVVYRLFIAGVGALGAIAVIYCLFRLCQILSSDEPLDGRHRRIVPRATRNGALPRIQPAVNPFFNPSAPPVDNPSNPPLPFRSSAAAAGGPASLCTDV